MTRKRRRKHQAGSQKQLGGQQQQLQKQKQKQKKQRLQQEQQSQHAMKEMQPDSMESISLRDEGSSAIQASPFEFTKEQTKVENSKKILQLEEEISLHEASLEVLKSRKQEVITQLQLKRSQKQELMQEQAERMDQKKGLETAQVRHLQLLHELRKSLSKSQERLKRLASASNGILSDDEIEKLTQELTAQEDKITALVIPQLKQQIEIHEEQQDQHDTEPKGTEVKMQSNRRVFFLRNIYMDKQQLVNFWQYQSNPLSNFCIFLPCIRTKCLIVKIMNMYARETLAMDTLYLGKGHRRESLEYTCLNIRLCVLHTSLPNCDKSQSSAYPELKEIVLSKRSMTDGNSTVLGQDIGDETKEALSYTNPWKEVAEIMPSSPGTDLGKLIGMEHKPRNLGRTFSRDSEEDEKYADAEDEYGYVNSSDLNNDEKLNVSRIFNKAQHGDYGEYINRSHHHGAVSKSPGISDGDYKNVDNRISPMIDWKDIDQTQRDLIVEGTLEHSENTFNAIVDPNLSLCPYELAGVCADAYCPYQHLKHREHGRVLPRELLPLPMLKLPPEPSPMAKLSPEPSCTSHIGQNYVPADDGSITADKAFEGLTAQNNESTLEKTGYSKCFLPSEKIPMRSDSSKIYWPNKSEVVRRKSSVTVPVHVVAHPKPPFKVGAETCALDKSEQGGEQRSGSLDKESAQKEGVLQHTITPDSDEKDPILANRDFVSLKNLSCEFSIDGETSDDDVDLVTAYLDDVGRSKKTNIWWMTPEKIAFLEKNSAPISLTDWFHLFAGFHVVGRKKNKLSVENIEEHVDNGCHASMILGKVVDCIRLAIHAGRFDLSGAFVCFASEMVNGLQASKNSSKILRDVVKCIKRADSCAFDRQSSIRATFDLQLLLSIISVFVEQLHNEYLSKEGDPNEETHSLFAANLYEICLALLPPNGEPGHKVIRSTESLVSEVRHKLFQLSPDVSETLDLCSYNNSESHCGNLKSLSLLSDVRLGKSCGLNMREASPSTLSEDILPPIWSLIRSFLRQHNNEDRQIIYIRGCIFMGFIFFGTMENVVDNFVDVKLASSTIAALTQLDNTIQRILLSLRKIVSDEPFMELLLTPLFAGCATLSSFLRLYGKTQHRLETFLWTGTNDDKNDNNNAHVFPLSSYSELLWSQLVHLRASLPFCARLGGVEDTGDSLLPVELSTDITEGHHVLALRIRQYGVHLHHLFLEGDWNLLHHLNTTVSSQTTSGENKSEPMSLEAAKEAYLALIQAVITDAKFPKSDAIKSFNLSNIPLIKHQRKINVPSCRSAFPRTLLLAGETMSVLNLSACSLANLPVSFGMYFRALKTLDLSFNQLRVLPNSIGLMSNLEDFNASRNRLSSLPDTIASLKLLRFIDFSYNTLQTLPVWLQNCSNLEELNVAFNLLSPDSDIYPLTQLTKLRMLKLQPQLPVNIDC